ncbi:MAG TPA: hypothetical protein VNQ73_10340 [Ilumatobacter sp.]|nr:hypothetical protein [Ilumatobacter sp.]
MSNDTAIPTTTPEATVDAVLSAYCDPDPARRQATIAGVWADDGQLLDPPLEGRGHAELSALTDVVLTHFPDHIFRRTSGVDVHHGCGRYSWELVAPTGGVGVAGIDFVEFTGDGKVARIVGFFGPLPDA